MDGFFYFAVDDLCTNDGRIYIINSDEKRFSIHKMRFRSTEPLNTFFQFRGNEIYKNIIYLDFC